MIRGSLDPLGGELVVSARVQLLGDEAKPMHASQDRSFQVDTGAYRSILAESELVHFGFTQREIDEYKSVVEPRKESFETVGQAKVYGYPIDASLYFLDRSFGMVWLVKHRVTLLIVQRAVSGEYPNLLGRDVLGAWNLRYCALRDQLCADSLRPSGRDIRRGRAGDAQRVTTV